ncbi:MAG: signal peptidase I [Desulfurococcaceae archaeon]
MDLKVILILLVLALMYFLTYFYKATSGLLFYYVQSTTYIAVVLLAWDEVRDYLKYGRFTVIISFFTLGYLSVYVMLGFWSGFGLTPYSTSPMGMAINVIHAASRICALEFLRAYVIHMLKYRYRRLAVHASTLVVWFLTWFPYPLLSLTPSMDSLKLAFRNLIPSFISSAFSTFIVLNHGMVSSIVYNLVPQLFIKVMPFLPRLGWFIEGALNTMTPLVGYSITLPYSRVAERNVRRMRSEVKRITRLITYFAAVMALIVVFQGYTGFRFYVISSRSMEPALSVGDIVVICNQCKDINVGDVVAYISKWGVVIHRVVELREDQKYVITKGDANRDPDLEPVPFENIIGKAVLRVPVLGYVSIFLHEVPVSSLRALLLAPLLALPIALYVFKRLKT